MYIHTYTRTSCTSYRLPILSLSSLLHQWARLQPASIAREVLVLRCLREVLQHVGVSGHLPSVDAVAAVVTQQTRDEV